MPADRDPRTDPRPGDVLRGKYLNGATCRRVVKSVTPYGNLFVQERGIGEVLIDPDLWREWAKNAEVIHRAD